MCHDFYGFFKGWHAGTAILVDNHGHNCSLGTAGGCARRVWLYLNGLKAVEAIQLSSLVYNLYCYHCGMDKGPTYTYPSEGCVNRWGSIPFQATNCSTVRIIKKYLLDQGGPQHNLVRRCLLKQRRRRNFFGGRFDLTWCPSSALNLASLLKPMYVTCVT